MNLIILTGNLGKDVDLRFTAEGKAVAGFSLAVKRPFGKGETDWFNIVVWGKNAENCANYIAKGSKVAVEGRVQFRDYETAEGQKRNVTEVVANSVEFLDSKKESNTATTQHDIDLNDFTPIDDSDDIPF